MEADFPLPENILDRLDWLEAEREMRVTRALAQQIAFRSKAIKK